MTKEEYIKLRPNFLGLLSTHIREKVRISDMECSSLIVHWEVLMKTSKQMMIKRYKINYTPSEAYHALVNYYDRKFELQLLYIEDKLLKIIL